MQSGVPPAGASERSDAEPAARERGMLLGVEELRQSDRATEASDPGLDLDFDHLARTRRTPAPRLANPRMSQPCIYFHSQSPKPPHLCIGPTENREFGAHRHAYLSGLSQS